MYILSIAAKLEHVSAQGILAVNYYYMCVPHLLDLKFFKSRVSVVYISHIMESTFYSLI